MYAVTIAAEQLVPAVLLLMLGAGWLGAYTLHTTLTWSLAVILLCVFASIGLPAATQPALTGSQHGSAAKALAALVGLATSFAGFAAMWAFFEIIGVQAGLSESFSAQWIAVGLLMTAAGPIAAAWVGNRWGRILPTSIPILIAVLAAAWLSNGVTSFTYATALVLFPLGYYFALNYFMSIVASADANGRFSSLMAFALALGAIGGPAVFGYLREVQGPAFAVMALLLIGSTLGFGAVQKSLDRTT